jgi:anti-sigma-K factor RskA
MTRDQETRDDLTVSYVLGELGPTETAAFERELAADAALAAEVQALRRAFAALPYATVTEPPSDLRDRVLSAARDDEAMERGGTGDIARSVDREGTLRIDRKGTRSLARPRAWWPAAITALAAGLALFFAFDARHLRRELALQREVTELLQQPNVVVGFALAGSGTAAGAYGNVVLDMDAGKGALALRGLPATPSGQVYRLWARSAGKDVLCGQFAADAERGARAQFVVPVRAYEGRVEQVFVTLEPLAETPQPTGPRILESL